MPQDAIIQRVSGGRVARVQEVRARVVLFIRYSNRPGHPAVDEVARRAVAAIDTCVPITSKAEVVRERVPV